MKITTETLSTDRARVDCVVVAHFEKEKALLPDAARVDRALGGLLSDLLKRGEFTGRANRTSLLYPQGKIPALRVVWVGLGPRGGLKIDRLRQAAGITARIARDHGAKTLLTTLHRVELPGVSLEARARAVAEATELAVYRFDKFKTEKEAAAKSSIESASLLASNVREARDLAGALAAGRAVADSVVLARDLINNPSGEVTPTRMAEAARAIAREVPHVRCTILEAAQMKTLGMGGVLGVARGSNEPPKFIVLDYRPPRGKRTVAIVGKGITFDSGGISIKPAEGMEQMKYDMSGGAAVLGTIRAAALLGLPVHLVGLVPATENMPGGKAQKPGDVLRALNGKTIEVINTDAEGRLILADALAYAERFRPEAIVDLATLTGACVVALGNQAMGMMGTDESLKSKIRAAGEETGERAWELPLWDEYDEQIKSDVADVKNTGGRGAGTITAAAFLKKFVPKGVPWVHLDIAGTAWADKDLPYVPKGGSGVGIRLLIRWLEHDVARH